jgi:hypothetical protein
MEARRVAYVFGFQLRGSIPLAQSQYLLFILMFDFSPVLPFFMRSWLQWDSDAFLFYCSQMNMDEYPHCTLDEDSWLWTMGRHCPVFPQVLLYALVQLSYDGLIPVYCCRPFQAHSLMCCKVLVEIPINPVAPWTRAVIGGDLDDAIEKMAYVALTVMCEQRLADTINTSIVLILIRDQEEPEWRQCLEAAGDLTRKKFNVGWAHMAKYAQYLFNL